MWSRLSARVGLILLIGTIFFLSGAGRAWSQVASGPSSADKAPAASSPPAQSSTAAALSPSEAFPRGPKADAERVEEQRDPAAMLPEYPEQAKAPQQIFESLPRFGASLFAALEQAALLAPGEEKARVSPGGAPASAATPVANLPVPPNYVLGPGDGLELSVWARNIEQLRETVTITPEGFILLPQIGRITAAGLTLEQLRQRLTDAYSRLFVEPKVIVVVSAQRTVEVFVLGDVRRPGKYTLPGMATVLSALYAAGGPSEIGSFRRIRLNRVGQPPLEIDLYDYLLTGRRDNDVVLAPGDSLFVPPVEGEVGLTGEIRRPGRYEIKGRLTIGDALALAGGLKPSAYAPLVHLWRSEGRARWVLRTLDCSDPRGPALQEPLQDGDLLIIKNILPRGENTIQVMGAVKRPGYYPWTPEATVASLLRAAEGVTWNAHMGLGLLRRMDRERHYTLIPFNVAEQLYDEKAPPIPVQPKDEIEILFQEAVEPAPEVRVEGAVARPGVYPFAKQMRVSHLLRLAGDLLPEAYLERADLLRLTPEQKYQLLAVDLKGVLAGDETKDLELARGDILKIRRQAEATPAPEVQIAGYVRNPGTYVRYEGMRVSDLIFAAGGLKPGAGPEITLTPGRFEGAAQPQRLTLSGTPEAFRVEPDVVLRDGDTVAVSGRGEFLAQAEVVVVQGRVARPGTYPLRRDGTRPYTLNDLLQDCGGLLPDGNPSGIVVYRRRELTADKAQTEDLNRVLSATNRESSLRPLQIDQETQAAAFGAGVAQNIATLMSPVGTSIVLPPRPVRVEDMVAAIPVAGRRLLETNGREGNIELEAGDNVVVPRRMNVVTVLGAVPRSGAVPYVAGFRCEDYIRESGGLREDADAKRLIVVHPNGATAPIRLRDPVEPGDVLVIPTKYLVRTVQVESTWQQWLRGIVSLVTAALLF